MLIWWVVGRSFMLCCCCAAVWYVLGRSLGPDQPAPRVNCIAHAGAIRGRTALSLNFFNTSRITQDRKLTLFTLSLACCSMLRIQLRTLLKLPSSVMS